jgi:transcriptional regulator with XRE-family HTH domain
MRNSNLVVATLQPPNNYNRYNRVFMPTKPGEWLRDRRKALGMTQEDVAKRAGVSVSYVSTLERGQTHSQTNAELRPSPEKVAALAKAVSGDEGELLILFGYAPENTVYLGNPRNLKELLDVLDRIPGFGGITFSDKFTDDDLDALSPEAFQEVVQAVQLAVTLTLERQSRSRPHDNPTADAPTKSPPHR